MCCILPCRTVVYCTILYGTVFFCTVPCCTVLWCAVLWFNCKRHSGASNTQHIVPNSVVTIIMVMVCKILLLFWCVLLQDPTSKDTCGTECGKFTTCQDTEVCDSGKCRCPDNYVSCDGGTYCYPGKDCPKCDPPTCANDANPVSLALDQNIPIRYCIQTGERLGSCSAGGIDCRCTT